MAEVKTEQWHFPTVVHLRLRDQSLLKFAPGVRNVPSDIGDTERNILRLSGATPVEEQPKQASSAPKSTSSASAKAEGTSGKKEENKAATSDATNPKEVSK